MTPKIIPDASQRAPICSPDVSSYYYHSYYYYYYYYYYYCYCYYYYYHYYSSMIALPVISPR